MNLNQDEPPQWVMGILGFSMNGEVTNKPNTHSGHLDWMDICKESAKVVTFIDLAGHEKYLKTTIFGMTGHVVCFYII